MASLNTLVVEDLENFRRFLCTTLEEKTPCDVDELSIGVEALVNGAQFVSSRLRHLFPTERPAASNGGYS
jgi:hypothetical protein